MAWNPASGVFGARWAGSRPMSVMLWVRSTLSCADRFGSRDYAFDRPVTVLRDADDRMEESCARRMLDASAASLHLLRSSSCFRRNS